MHGRRLTPVLLLVVICFPSTLVFSFPATITSITVEGNSQVSSREILDWLSSRPSLPISQEVLDRDLRLLQEGYRKLGYLSAQTDSVSARYSSDSSEVRLVLYVTEGRQTVVGSLIVSGNTLMTQKEIFENFDLGVGDPLDEVLLEADINALLERYEHLGRPLASCEVSSLITRSGEDRDSLDVTLSLDEGPGVTIDEIRVAGNVETDPDVVLRETRLKKGEPFDPEKVDAIRGRLSRLNIFSSVSEPELYQRDHVNGLLIKVQEGRSNTFDGVLGYIPAKNEGETGFLTGLVSVTMRNLFGTGRKFGFHWQREDQNTQELGVQYLEPWIFGFPLNVGLGFFQRQQDTSYVRRTLNLKNELMLTERLSISLLLESDDVIPSAEISTTRILNTSIRTIGAELSYDTRNDFISPTSGARYRTDYQYGTQTTRNIPTTLAGSIQDAVHVHKLGIDLDFYLSTFSRQVIAAGLHGRQIQSSQIDEGQMYRFGGANTLRGYRENQFIGSLVGWTNTEYRILLARRSFVYAFMDTGYYFRQSDDVRQIPSAEDFKLGYGVGLQIETAVGHLGVSFALGEGDSFSTAKVHFGLVNEF